MTDVDVQGVTKAFGDGLVLKGIRAHVRYEKSD